MLKLNIPFFSLLFVITPLFSNDTDKTSENFLPSVELSSPIDANDINKDQNKVSENACKLTRVGIVKCTDQTDFEKIVKDFIKVAKDPNLHALLLIVDCNGGAVDKFSSLHDMIKKIVQKKPVVGLIIGSARSGGYLLASATQYLIAHTASDVGSIGAIRTIDRFHNTQYKNDSIKADLDVTVFTAGKYKGMSYEYQDGLSEHERQYIQDETNKRYHLFLQLVAENRGISLDNYYEWADGKNIIASEALQLKLIDEIGTIFDAEQKLLELIRIQNPTCEVGEEVEFVETE